MQDFTGPAPLLGDVLSGLAVPGALHRLALLLAGGEEGFDRGLGPGGLLGRGPELSVGLGPGIGEQ
ncbi:hypothetical protein [Nocardioides sp. B-3]|uniref:hypothetical protein n=1 Tax=Nocardioides sp. B-3 TaxID=2895565 RepID=UPI002152242A|nr:hypothetical protein [Nocardioides sp. B-3]UUZ61299.1 hypothetical protein LP418_12330 [Nocardioides sp. B-3]